MDGHPTSGGGTTSERPAREQLISELEYAIRRERYSQMRYRESARLARNDELRALLLQLANEEIAHEAKLKKQLQRLIEERGSVPPLKP